MTLNYLLCASEFSGAGDQTACVSTERTGPSNLLLHIVTGPPFLCTRALEKLVPQSLSSETEVEVLVPKDQGLLYSVSFVNLVYLYMVEEIMSCNTN